MQVGSYFQRRGFPAGSLRGSEFFSAGCLGRLGIRRWCTIPMPRLRRLPKRHLSLPFPPAVPADRLRWVCSELFQIAKDTVHAESRFFREQHYWSRRLLSQGGGRRGKCEWAGEDLRDFPVSSSDTSVISKIVLHPTDIQPSFSCFLWWCAYHLKRDHVIPFSSLFLSRNWSVSSI